MRQVKQFAQLLRLIGALDERTCQTEKNCHELRQLKEENARLKKIVAEPSLDKAILQDVATRTWGGPSSSSAVLVSARRRMSLPSRAFVCRSLNLIGLID